MEGCRIITTVGEFGLSTCDAKEDHIIEVRSVNPWEKATICQYHFDLFSRGLLHLVYDPEHRAFWYTLVAANPAPPKNFKIVSTKKSANPPIDLTTVMAQAYEQWRKGQEKMEPQTPREDRPEMLARSEGDPTLNARLLVRDNYYNAPPNYLGLQDIYVVWFCYILGGWKALVSTNAKDHRYYEVTHNHTKNETYVDAYGKVDNITVPGS